MLKQLLVCLELEKLRHFQRPIDDFIAVDLFLFFNIYCICGEAYFHDDIKSDDEYFRASCSGYGERYHKKCINIQVNGMEWKWNGNALFTENKVYELYNLCNENKRLICGGLM